MSDDKRTPAGQFRPGVSGNPTGRSKALAEVQEMARSHTVENISLLMEIARNKKAPPQARVAANSAVLDRAWGKPAQTIEAEITKAFAFELPLTEENEEQWLNKLQPRSVQ